MDADYIPRKEREEFTDRMLGENKVLEDENDRQNHRIPFKVVSVHPLFLKKNYY